MIRFLHFFLPCLIVVCHPPANKNLFASILENVSSSNVTRFRNLSIIVSFVTMHDLLSQHSHCEVFIRNGFVLYHYCIVKLAMILLLSNVYAMCFEVVVCEV